jgi:hypothetical protein
VVFDPPGFVSASTRQLLPSLGKASMSALRLGSIRAVIQLELSCNPCPDSAAGSTRPVQRSREMCRRVCKTCCNHVRKNK